MTAAHAANIDIDAALAEAKREVGTSNFEKMLRVTLAALSTPARK